MKTFLDYYNNQVRLSFEYEPFSTQAKHVWVICQYKGRWVLTNHPRRGYEFPGGKVEKGELPEAAAIREVWEETGGRIENLHYLGQYEVSGRADVVIKNIYAANLSQLIEKRDYMETKGPAIYDLLPENIREDSSFSFIMKDEVLKESLTYIKNHLMST
ncbi:RNA deprotection pyrophosphohydrolase [Salsuginibacillus kocurii]|uniref:RNA deprotection pyrophosphohydrolase n=1 Tax=Salsuginibacillus kocurii TaxID=427078 RepID=UPI0003608EC9|nr:nucleoside triphosphatase YtkD [Salsuginibacillus kocurii]